jgi:hypothetical protein
MTTRRRIGVATTSHYGPAGIIAKFQAFCDGDAVAEKFPTRRDRTPLGTRALKEHVSKRSCPVPAPGLIHQLPLPQTSFAFSMVCDVIDLSSWPHKTFPDETLRLRHAATWVDSFIQAVRGRRPTRHLLPIEAVNGVHRPPAWLTSHACGLARRPANRLTGRSSTRSQECLNGARAEAVRG